MSIPSILSISAAQGSQALPGLSSENPYRVKEHPSPFHKIGFYGILSNVLTKIDALRFFNNKEIFQCHLHQSTPL